MVPFELYTAALSVLHVPNCKYIAVLMDEQYILPPTFPSGQILSRQHGTLCRKWEASLIVDWFHKNVPPEEHYHGNKNKQGVITDGNRQSL